jgi:hypothetical protein
MTVLVRPVSTDSLCQSSSPEVAHNTRHCDVTGGRECECEGFRPESCAKHVRLKITLAIIFTHFTLSTARRLYSTMVHCGRCGRCQQRIKEQRRRQEGVYCALKSGTKVLAQILPKSSLAHAWLQCTLLGT